MVFDNKKTYESYNAWTFLSLCFIATSFRIVSVKVNYANLENFSFTDT